MPPRIDDGTRAAILADIKAGQKSRAQIGRDHGVSPQTVKNIADENGIDQPFSREQTKNATEARAADNAARRAEISTKFLSKAAELLDQIDQPHLVHSFGGRDNIYNEHELDRPPTGDIRNLMISAATAFDKHMAAEKHDSGAGAEQVGSLLGAMFDEMARRHADPEAQ